MPVELSVIIPTIEERDEDVICLDYLARQDFESYEVIVRRDEGAARARNEGVKRATADKLVFLDDDSMPRDGFLNVVNRALDDHPAVVGKVLQPDDAPITHLRLPWYDQGDEPKRTQHVPGCNMAIRRRLFEDIGGFNETFYHGHEEYELGKRLTEASNVQYIPEMVVEHYFAESLTQYWLKMYRHGKADIDLWDVEDVPRSRRIRRTFIPRIHSVHPYDIIGRAFQTAGRLRGFALRL